MDMGLLHPRVLAVQLLMRSGTDGTDGTPGRPGEPLPRRRTRTTGAPTSRAADVAPAPAPTLAPDAAVAVPQPRTRWDKVIYLERPTRAAADGSAR
jgi:hypothetical protein